MSTEPKQDTHALEPKRGSCWLFHNWSKWITTENRPFGYSYWLVRQQRQCLTCGKLALREKII